MDLCIGIKIPAGGSSLINKRGVSISTFLVKACLYIHTRITAKIKTSK